MYLQFQIWASARVRESARTESGVSVYQRNPAYSLRYAGNTPNKSRMRIDNLLSKSVKNGGILNQNALACEFIRRPSQHEIEKCCVIRLDGLYRMRPLPQTNRSGAAMTKARPSRTTSS